MNWNNFLHDDRVKFSKESHGLFSPSNYHWTNYSLEKAMAVYNKSKMKEVGTQLHELAAMLIKMKVCLPDEKRTLNMYVNDAIFYSMVPEKQLYFSEEFRGTADAIIVDHNDVLRIHDLKTGEIKASLRQLEIYTALFCLDCDVSPADFNGIELRIYQSDDIITGRPEVDDILPIMDQIVTIDKLIRRSKESSYGL